jgi:hypothetical protein
MVDDGVDPAGQIPEGDLLEQQTLIEEPLNDNEPPSATTRLPPNQPIMPTAGNKSCRCPKPTTSTPTTTSVSTQSCRASTERHPKRPDQATTCAGGSAYSVWTARA